MKGKRPTREDVAREAGTSVAVVTYSLNNGPRPVAPKTKERVLAAVKKLGYQPNRAARVLASGKSNVYGLVLPNITNPFIAEIAHAFQARVMARGKTIMLGDLADDPTRERELLKLMISHQVDGVVYMGTVENLALDLFEDSDIPVVVLTYADSDFRCPSVRIDETQAVYALTRHLVLHGYKKIAMLTGPKGMKNSFVRAKGWCQAMNSDLESENISWRAYSRAAGYSWLKTAYEAGTIPDAVVTGNERQAIGILAACADINLKVPQDLALVALNGSSSSGFTTPSLTSIRQPWGEMADCAFSILSSPELSKLTRATMSGFDLVIGSSCGCDHKQTNDRRLIASWSTPSSETLDSAAGLS